MKLLDFLNYIQPELLVPFLASFWGCGARQVRFREKNIEFIRQKSRFSQFWTFMPIISNLLEHLKISIMPPTNDWKVVYNIKTVQNITLEAIWSLQIEDTWGLARVNDWRYFAIYIMLVSGNKRKMFLLSVAEIEPVTNLEFINLQFFLFSVLCECVVSLSATHTHHSSQRTSS